MKKNNKNKRPLIYTLVGLLVAISAFFGTYDFDKAINDIPKDVGFGDIATQEENAEGIYSRDDQGETQGSSNQGSSVEYNGKDVISVNGGRSEFTQEELDAAISEKPYEEYAPLDSLGRCGQAIGVLDMSMMPTEERGGIGQYKPSGWQTITYPDLISTRYLYNRGHLLAHCLGGESTNNRNNLITMTRQCNENMIPYEVKTARYLEENPKHKVIYRVTPEFEGDNLVAKGVHMEIRSLGDDRINENIYLFNVQDGIKINYKNGNSERA